MARCGCTDNCSCLLVAGDNVTIIGNGSAANPYVITGAPSYTDEQARDAVGLALVAGNGISIAVNDGGDTITISNTAEDSDIRAVTTTQALPDTDEIVLASNAITLTLPAAAAYAGRRLSIKNMTGDVLTITPAAGTIDGAASKTLSILYTTLELVTDGTNWFEISSVPIYLQALLVSGNVSVANHVLKPGLRVPAASLLREVVLRCETAPTGASITVQVERFNGGVSMGIIATASITATNNVGSVSGLSAACAKGDMLKFNVTSIGSGTAGADLSISLDMY